MWLILTKVSFGVQLYGAGQNEVSTGRGSDRVIICDPVATGPGTDCNAYLAGRSNQVNTSTTKHSAIITSAQKNEMKSL